MYVDISIIVLVPAALFFIGLIAGYNAKHSPKPDGVMHVCLDDPNKDIYTLELWTPFAELPFHKEIVFKVSVDNHNKGDGLK